MSIKEKPEFIMKKHDYFHGNPFKDLFEASLSLNKEIEKIGF